MPKRKVFGLLARPEELSKQQFQDHYRHPHGTMGLSISTLRDYVQCHQFESALLGPEQNRFQIVAELWFDNSQDIETLRSEPMMNAFHNADEWKFVDMHASRSFIGEETVLQSGAPFADEMEPQARWRHFARPNSVKLLQFFERRDGLAANADVSLGQRLQCYRQTLCLPAEPYSLDPRDRSPQFSGVREYWWPTATELERSAAADRAAWDELVGSPGVHNILAVAEWYR